MISTRRRRRLRPTPPRRTKAEKGETPLSSQKKEVRLITPVRLKEEKGQPSPPSGGKGGDPSLESKKGGEIYHSCETEGGEGRQPSPQSGGEAVALPSVAHFYGGEDQAKAKAKEAEEKAMADAVQARTTTDNALDKVTCAMQRRIDRMLGRGEAVMSLAMEPSPRVKNREKGRRSLLNRHPFPYGKSCVDLLENKNHSDLTLTRNFEPTSTDCGGGMTANTLLYPWLPNSTWWIGEQL
jgi:hypothetical protein